MQLAFDVSAPAYLRMGKSDRGDVHQLAITFKARQLLPLRTKKIALIATGSMVFAAQALVQQGLDAEAWSAPSIKQMDSATLAGIRRRVDCIITLEEHSVLNGLGSAVPMLVAEARPLPVYRIGINDKFSSLRGTYDYLLEEHNLTVHAIHQKTSIFWI